MRWIARNFVAASEIEAIAISCGSSQTLAAHAAGRGGSWGEKGVILFGGRDEHGAIGGERQPEVGVGVAVRLDEGQDALVIAGVGALGELAIKSGNDAKGSRLPDPGPPQRTRTRECQERLRRRV